MNFGKMIGFIFLIGVIGTLPRFIPILTEASFFVNSISIILILFLTLIIRFKNGYFPSYLIYGFLIYLLIGILTLVVIFIGISDEISVFNFSKGSYELILSWPLALPIGVLGLLVKYGFII